MKNADIVTSLRPLLATIRRFHITLFIVLITAGLVMAVLWLDHILNQTTSTSSDSSTSTTLTIDQATVNKLNALYTSNDAPSTYTLPSGRINPFSES